MENELKKALEKIEKLGKEKQMLVFTLLPLANIAVAWQNNKLDESRPEWGDSKDKHIDLLCGRGGKPLLTLTDAIKANDVINKIS